MASSQGSSDPIILGSDVKDGYLFENFRLISKEPGLWIKVIKEGKGPYVPKGCTLRIHYMASFLDGTIIESSASRGEPLEFTQGKGQVISALEEGVLAMKFEEKAEFLCFPNYAYGAQGVPSKIPPNSVIRLLVEILEWDPNDLSPKKDGGILRYVLESGTGLITPKFGSTVDVTLVGQFDGEEFCNSRLQFCLGEGIASSVPRGLEKAIKKMKMGERDYVLIRSEYAFGPEGCEVWNIPPNTNVSYTVTLHEFNVCTDWWDMSCSERLVFGRALKEKGSFYYSSQLYQLSVKLWKKLVHVLETQGGFSGEEEEERRSLLLAGLLNLSLGWLKLEHFVNARDAASKALELDENNVKAYYRRGKAWYGFNEPNIALEDFARVLELEPNNSAAAFEITVCKQRAREIALTEKQIYANMFDKFAQQDKEKEEEKARKEEDVLAKVGEWGISERGHQPTDFERENPNILMLDKDGDFKDM